MTIAAIILALLLAFFAFRFVAGMIKLAMIALILLAGIFVVRHAGAF